MALSPKQTEGLSFSSTFYFLTLGPDHLMLLFPEHIPACLSNSKLFSSSRKLSLNPQFSSVTQLCPTLCNSMDCNIPGFSVHHKLLGFAQTHVHWVSDAIQPSHPLSSPSAPAFNLSIRVFSSESALPIRWPKYWSFSFSISPSNVHPGLISFSMDWLDLLEVQGTLKSLLQHHSSKASVLYRSAFCIVQLSHPYLTTGKTIALTGWIFVGKAMSLLFNMLSRLVIAFLPKEHTTFNFMAAVTICSNLKVKENKICYCFHCFHIYLLWGDGTGCHYLRFLNVEF